MLGKDIFILLKCLLAPLSWIKLDNEKHRILVALILLLYNEYYYLGSNMGSLHLTPLPIKHSQEESFEVQFPKKEFLRLILTCHKPNFKGANHGFT